MRAHPEALYFHIARRVLDDIEHEKDEFQLAQRVGTAIVFSALTLEAFINQEFGLHQETRKIIEVEKGLTLKAKWLILPLLLQCSPTFMIGEMPFQKFSELVMVRTQSSTSILPTLILTRLLLHKGSHKTGFSLISLRILS
jgi:hypothetical protein